jgi:hypothetical protein
VILHNLSYDEVHAVVNKSFSETQSIRQTMQETGYHLMKYGIVWDLKITLILKNSNGSNNRTTDFRLVCLDAYKAPTKIIVLYY